jgi:hypothetical protein
MNDLGNEPDDEPTPWPQDLPRWPVRPEHDGDLWAVIVENPHLPSLTFVVIGLTDSYDTALNLAHQEASLAEHEDIASLILGDVDEERETMYENGDGIVYFIQKCGVYVR